MKRYIGDDLRKVDVIDLKAHGHCDGTIGRTYVVYSYDTDMPDENGYRIMEHTEFHSKFKQVENYKEELR